MYVLKYAIKISEINYKLDKHIGRLLKNAINTNNKIQTLDHSYEITFSCMKNFMNQYSLEK